MTLRFLSLVFLIGCLLSCGRRHEEKEINNDMETEILNEDFESELLSMADSIVRQMTLEERVGQLYMPTVDSSADPFTIRLIKRYISDLHVGGVVLLKGDLASASKIAALCREAQVPLFVAIDAEWGLGMRLKDAPEFPKNGTMGNNVDEMFMFDYGREIGRECKLLGINMILGPVVDVVEKSGGIIGKRSFGNDPERVEELSTAYALGIESVGIISVAKHFPGHGSPSGDSHKVLPVIERDYDKLDSIDLPPFRGYVAAGLSGIMVGHLAVPAVDSTAVPAAVSKNIIDGLLKKDIGFKGLILTDALNMGGASGFSGADALLAGADIVLAPENPQEEIQATMKMVREGKLPLEDIDDKCRKIIFYKLFAVYGAENVANIDRLKEDIIKGAEEISKRLSDKT